MRSTTPSAAIASAFGLRTPVLGTFVLCVSVLCTPLLAGAQADSAPRTTLPETIPIFPLQDVTLFPNSSLQWVVSISNWASYEKVPVCSR